MSRAEFLRRQAERLRAAQERSRQLQAEEEEAAARAQTSRNQPNLATWQGLVEQRILDGIAQGWFDNLQGSGKPLNLYDDAFVPEEMRMAFRVLRSNGLAPLWVEINKEIQEDIARLQRMRVIAHQRWGRTSADDRHRLREQYASRVAEINTKIINHNLLAPSSYVHLGPLIVETEMDTFDDVTMRGTKP